MIITKPCAFVVSGGRTGTSYINDFINRKFRDVRSFHEPDNIDSFRPGYLRNMAQEFGDPLFLFKKVFGQWGLKNLSNQRLAGKITDTEAAEKLYHNRHNFVEQSDARIFVETSYNYNGLLDIIPTVFQDYRIVFIIRDPRDWVRSHMNVREWYYYSNPNTILGTRLSAEMVGDEPYASRWQGFSRFEKLCWAWNYLNVNAVRMLREVHQSMVIRFEDLFDKSNDGETLRQTIEFITRMESSPEIDYRQELSRTVGPSAEYTFPRWPDWDADMAMQLETICGEFMEEMGYGEEEEWNRILQHTSKAGEEL